MKESIEGQQILKSGPIMFCFIMPLMEFIEQEEWHTVINWMHLLKKYPQNPVFMGGSTDQWDGMHVSTSYLYNIKNHWYLFYQGTNSNGFYSDANWDIGMTELNEGN